MQNLTPYSLQFFRRWYVQKSKKVQQNLLYYILYIYYYNNIYIIYNISHNFPFESVAKKTVNCKL